MTTKPENDIKLYFHCRKCLAMLPPDTTPREWVKIEAGFTKEGVQVWCVRHEENVIHIDFEGRKHPLVGSKRRG